MIADSRTKLRAIERSDLEFLTVLANDPIVSSSVVEWSFPVSASNQDIWYEKICGERSEQRFTIEDSNGERVGMAGYYEIDFRNRSASLGIKLVPAVHGRGLGTDVIGTLVRYAFESIGLHRLSCTILASNAASRRAFEKSGFKVEGCLQSAVFKNGSWQDVYLLASLRVGDNV